MTASFCAYIDEAGDEGFKFRRPGSRDGSSDWFVIAALITRAEFDLPTVKKIDEVRQEFGLAPKKHLHWKDLKHPEKVRYSQILAGLGQACAAVVAVHKPSLAAPEKFKGGYRLYFYLTRFLLERISWLVRDGHRTEPAAGDGTVDIIFSNRQGMSYTELVAYIEKLRSDKDSGQEINIDFNHLKPDRISAHTPGKSMGLQLADAVASGFFNGLERDHYGNTEPRYAKNLKPMLYRHAEKLEGYGLKIFPGEKKGALKCRPELEWLEEFE